MGASVSSEYNAFNDLTDNDSLLLFAKELSIPEGDPFWDNFLTFTLRPPTTRELDEAINNKLKPICKTLYLNAHKSGNFSTLLKYVVAHSSVDSLIPTEAENQNQNQNQNRSEIRRCRLFNALFITRCYMKYLIEHTNEAELLNQFSPPPLDTIKKDDSKFVTFQDYMQILVNILVNLPLTDNTYNLHIEAINSLFVLLSIPLFACVPANAAYKWCLQQLEDQVLRALLLHLTNKKYNVYDSFNIIRRNIHRFC